ncbi:MAG TPA: UDP-glucose/GDP-mannose dehydrogenase family protein [Terriglobales bacterium]|nr:UDP-glucose/GDP-mannose dehydrogenase family protein [Terriglobales bacterium]
MKIAIVGCGYVGLVTGVCFAEIGHEVICIDSDHSKITLLRKGTATIYEEFLPELLQKNQRGRLSFKGSIQEAISGCEAVFIAVGTPGKADGSADLSAVEVVAAEITKGLTGFTVIVQKSTVPVKTGDRLQRIISRLRPEADFEVVSNPEFLREGTAVTDFLYADRIVLGCNSPRAASVMRRIYEPLLSGSYGRTPDAVPVPRSGQSRPRLIETSRNSAELIKYAANSFLSMKVSFINAMANLCQAAGADIDEVAAGIGSDSRIGPKFLRAGLGYGGSCFPKDVAALDALASEWGCELGLLREVQRINEGQRTLYVDKVREVLDGISGKRIAALGLAFKARTDDIRCSPAIAVIEALLEEGATVCAYDPAAMPNAKRQVRHPHLSFAADPYAAARDAHALLVLTDWEEFRTLDLRRLQNSLVNSLIFDGRNLYSPKSMAAQGFSYYSIGRAAAIPATCRHTQPRRSLTRATAASAEAPANSGD